MDTSFLANLTPIEFKAVWTALQQFVDNQDDCADELPPEALAAQILVEKMDAAFIAAVGA